VRTGYLAALASRAVGAAPVLKPPTPSRFEPDSPQAELPEVAEVHQTAQDQVAGSGRRPRLADEAAADTILTAAPSLRGFFGPDLDQGRPAANADQDGAALADREVPEGRQAQNRRQRQTDRETRPVPASSRDPARVPGDTVRVGRPAGSTAGVLMPAQAALLAPEAAAGPAATEVSLEPGWMASSRRRGASWPGDGGESWPPDRPSGPQPRPAGAPETPGPAIVVRIGRVDVRAVQATPPTAPPLRPRPPAGPSLQEHLRARDRGRR
jgi:hypothetical protein